MPLDLLVPDLLLPTDAPPGLRALRLRALEKWLARADTTRVPGSRCVDWLAARYAIGSPVPVAAIALAGEGGTASGAWMRADPVHLRIDHDYVKLHDASSLGVTREEATALVAALQAHFAGDGLEFRALAADRWYVRAPEGTLPKTTPLEEANGRDVFGLLPEETSPRRSPGPNASRAINWRSTLTEAQMMMSTHEVNERREALGKPAINSVWFWGEGSLPPNVSRPYALVYANDAFARGLGAVSGAEVRPPPKGIAEVDLVRPDDSALVALDALTAPLHRGDEAAWTAAAQGLDAGWFAGIGDAIARFGEVRLVLPAERDTRVARLDSNARWRWFRSRKPLAAHA